MDGETITLTDLILRYLLAALLGGLIGLEREFHGRPAGLRTHILVCLGAAIIMSSGQLYQNFYSQEGAESVFRIDPGRITAGIVTGIGFLGAGAIIRSRDIVRGLTTAACIWFVAGLGIVVGGGLYLPGIVGCVLGLILLVCLDPIGHGIPAVYYGSLSVTAEMTTAEDIEEKCRTILKGYPVSIQNTSISASTTTGRRVLTMFVRRRGLKNKHEILKKILAEPGVIRVSWD
jgi:putative Mg2+ transporter-C (MgtC) family protein